MIVKCGVFRISVELSTQPGGQGHQVRRKRRREGRKCVSAPRKCDLMENTPLFSRQ
jgi:hypothetical protein